MPDASLYRRVAKAALTSASRAVNPAERWKFFEIAAACFDRAAKEDTLARKPARGPPGNQSVRQQDQRAQSNDSESGSDLD
jgi:hypothetical protein